MAPECRCWISGPGLGVWILRVVMKRLCRVVSCLRLSAEKPPGSRECYGYHSLSHWSKLAFSLIQRSCSENRTLSASVSAKTDFASDPSALRPVRPDLRCNALPHPTLPDATWQRSLRPDAS